MTILPVENLNHIPVENMRQALEDSGLSFTAASVALGWGRDGQRLKKELGITARRKKVSTDMDYKIAAAMVKAWRVDPVEYGV